METLSKCEEEIFITILKSEEAPNLGKIMEAANERYEHKWKPQTISTFLQRLVKKGYLDTKRKGRYSFYYPVFDLETYQRRQITELRKNLFDDDIKLFEECVRTSTGYGMEL